jgi:hypothetical protein
MHRQLVCCLGYRVLKYVPNTDTRVQCEAIETKAENYWTCDSPEKSVGCTTF